MPNDIGLPIELPDKPEWMPEEVWRFRPQEPNQGPPLPDFLNIFWPWYTPPTITISGLIVSPKEVQVGMPVEITCVAFNATSEAAARVIELKVEGTIMAQKTVTLEPGESTTVSFTVTPTAAKTYSVSVNGLYGSFKATEEVPPGAPDIRVESLVIEPAEVLVGETVMISVTVTNYGDAAGSKTVTCTVS